MGKCAKANQSDQAQVWFSCNAYRYRAACPASTSAISPGRPDIRVGKLRAGAGKRSTSTSTANGQHFAHEWSRRSRGEPRYLSCEESERRRGSNISLSPRRRNRRGILTKHLTTRLPGPKCSEAARIAAAAPKLSALLDLDLDLEPDPDHPRLHGGLTKVPSRSDNPLVRLTGCCISGTEWGDIYRASISSGLLAAADS